MRLVGFLPGITSPGGASHQAVDDIGAVRMLPNMTIVEAGDATEVEQIIDVAHKVDGPVYIRQLRGEVPRLFDPADRMVLGKSRCLSSGTDLLLLSSGICTEEAMRATEVLAARGVRIEHRHVSTLKPFDDPEIVESVARSQRGVITMENHSVTGGLGTAVAEVMAAHRFGVGLRKIGVRDTFTHGGSRPYLMEQYGLDANTLVRTVEQAIGEPLDITSGDLAAVWA